MGLVKHGWRMVLGLATAAGFLGLAIAQNASTPLGVCRSTSASPTAYTCPAPPLLTYLGNLSVSWTPDVTNTTQTPTLNLGPCPKLLKDPAGNNLLLGAVIGGAVYIVAFDGTFIRVLSGPGVNPTTINYQQSAPTLCYDTTAGDTANFNCSRTPSGAPLTTGSTILFRFAASFNAANPCVNVEGTGCGQISYSDGSAVQSGLLAGDGSGTENTYLLTFDADDDIWVLANQTLPGTRTPLLLTPNCGTVLPLRPPTIVGSDRGGTVTPGGTTTACTIPFTGTYANAPSCVVTSQGGLTLTYSVSTTAIQVNSTSTLGGTTFNYSCNFN